MTDHTPDVVARILAEMDQLDWPRPFSEDEREGNRQFCFQAGMDGRRGEATLKCVRLIERYEASLKAALAERDSLAALVAEAEGAIKELTAALARQASEMREPYSASTSGYAYGAKDRARALLSKIAQQKGESDD